MLLGVSWWARQAHMGYRPTRSDLKQADHSLAFWELCNTEPKSPHTIKTHLQVFCWIWTKMDCCEKDRECKIGFAHP